jgi:hypothetical protein
VKAGVLSLGERVHACFNQTRCVGDEIFSVFCVWHGRKSYLLFLCVYKYAKSMEAASGIADKSARRHVN